MLLYVAEAQEPVFPGRRGARAADWVRLESVCTRKGTQGSNPCLSASICHALTSGHKQTWLRESRRHPSRSLSSGSSPTFHGSASSADPGDFRRSPNGAFANSHGARARTIQARPIRLRPECNGSSRIRYVYFRVTYSIVAGESITWHGVGSRFPDLQFVQVIIERALRLSPATAGGRFLAGPAPAGIAYLFTAHLDQYTLSITP
jgi:hypothetical protein